ncbi:TPA: HNH endonuclease [Salmonella enterica subsp. enterica]
MTNFISQDYLRKIMHYDETSVNFTLIKKKRGTKHRFKKNAGYLNRNGYIEIRIDGKLFKAHRLAWIYVYGKEPPDVIDHINRIRSDNRINNLREANATQNRINSKVSVRNTSGVKGISWDSSRNSWVAYAAHSGKIVFLGRFIDKKNAIKAREMYVNNNYDPSFYHEN